MFNEINDSSIKWKVFHAKCRWWVHIFSSLFCLYVYLSVLLWVAAQMCWNYAPAYVDVVLFVLCVHSAIQHDFVVVLWHDIALNWGAQTTCMHTVDTRET